MGKAVEVKKKKKKGRPSLLDLQKRILKEQQQQQPRPKSDSRTTPIKPTPFRRSIRRNPSPEVISPPAEETAGEDDDESDGKRREKKLKLVLKLPPSSLNSDSYGSDSNAKDGADAKNRKKQKINPIASASAPGEAEKAEKHVSASNPINTVPGGTQLEMGPSTPLPDKKLLLFILDRLQKKDTYGVFAEPVEPEELPDYHEIVEHPMDFGTVRNKLDSGTYANLEQFEKDVFLICSNAMQYNAPDTIYFRQARSIQELAKKSFENLRQDSDDNEPEHKIVRRGRPPTKNFKKNLGRPSMENTGSEFSSDATLATGAENSPLSSYDLRKGALSYKSSAAGITGQTLYGSFNGEASLGSFSGQKLKGNDEYAGSLLKGNLTKLGKTQVVLDESRRNTYRQSLLSADTQEPSVLTTFDAERKQLISVGVHMEYGYARSLARFAANLGPVAWKVASKKIEKSLPVGVKFGPGWVGENEMMTQPQLFQCPPVVQASLLDMFSQPGNLDADAISGPADIRGDKSSKDPERQKCSEMLMPSTHSALDSRATKPLLSSGHTFLNATVGNKYVEPITGSPNSVRIMNSHTDVKVMTSSDGVRPRPPLHNYQNLAIHSGSKGFNGTYGLHLPTQMGKLIGSAMPPGINIQSYNDTFSSISTNLIRPVTPNRLHLEDSRFLENASRIISGDSVGDSGHEKSAAPKVGIRAEPCHQEVPLQTKVESVPPDLNVKFQSPGSPTSSRIDTQMHPDLALQL